MRYETFHTNGSPNLEIRKLQTTFVKLNSNTLNIAEYQVTSNITK